MKFLKYYPAVGWRGKIRVICVKKQMSKIEDILSQEIITIRMLAA